VSGLKQLAWVVPFTVLIWAFAEREQQINGDIRFPLVATSSNPKVAVHLIEPRDGYVTVNLRAPRRRLEELSRDLALRSTPVRFEIPTDKAGSHQFPVRLVIDRDSRFDAVTINGNKEIIVEVEPIEERKIPVAVREEDRARFDQVVFVPDKVTVRMPRRLWPDPKQQIVAYADLSSISDQAPGPKSNIPGLRVSVPTSDPDSVTIEPSTVSAASLVVLQRDREYEIPNLIVLESVPTRLRNDFDVKLNRYNILKVVISGPAAIVDEIERTEGKEIKAHVSIDYSFTEPSTIGQAQDANVWFTLPEGVKIKSKVEPVKVTVTNRSPQ
jgi:hypothetical protein